MHLPFLVVEARFSGPQSGAGNPAGSRFRPMPLTTADIGIQLLMDTTAALQEMKARMTARAFNAVHNPEQGPAVRQVLEQLVALLDSSSTDGRILLSATGNTAVSRIRQMTHDHTNAQYNAAFLALLHHVIFEMTPEQAAALMADDEPITPPALRPPDTWRRSPPASSAWLAKQCLSHWAKPAGTPAPAIAAFTIRHPLTLDNAARRSSLRAGPTGSLSPAPAAFAGHMAAGLAQGDRVRRPRLFRSHWRPRADGPRACSRSLISASVRSIA